MICTTNLICQCSQTFYYFDYLTLSCLPQGTYLASCSIDYNCRVDRYLNCVFGTCQCISSFPVWSVGFNKCIVPASYSQSCFTTTDCDTSSLLVCNTGSTCDCPTNLPINTCDCPVRIYGKEYFWNGSTCAAAYEYNQICTSSSTNYMCQTLTQGTICSGNKCSCPSTQYFYLNNNTCQPLVSINGTCTQPNACKSSLGLICQNGLCQCNATSQFWSFSSCINYLTYTAGPCTADNQCYGNLICRTGGSSCSCPQFVSTNNCDCPPSVFGSEYFWNGTCTIARSYNESCTSSYQCQSTTQLTSCISGICTCNSNSVWNSTQCLSCPWNSWKLYRGSCFRGSSSTVNNIDTISSNTLQNVCYNQGTARLAILDNPDALANVFISPWFNQNDYWFDAMRPNGFSSSKIFYSFYSSNAMITFNSSFWNSLTSSDLCATFQTNTQMFQSNQCSSNFPLLCEIVLV